MRKILTMALAGGATALMVLAAGCGGDDSTLGPSSSSGTGGASSSGGGTGGTTTSGGAAGGGGASSGGGGGASSSGGGTGGSASGTGGTGPGNNAPIAEIYHPGNGECRLQGVPFPVIGVANDAEDGPLTGSSLVWTCSVEGQIGTGGNFNHTPVGIGQHVITLTATDSNQATGTDNVTLDIQTQCN